MKSNHRPQTVDGGRYYYPLSTVHPLAICLLAVLLASCQPPRTVAIALLGDINLGRGVSPSADSFSVLTSELLEADLALANLESPLAPLPPETDSNYNLCAPAERASLLAAWGLDLLSIANNHASDCSPDGPGATQSALAEAGLGWVGPQPVYREINALKLAFLAFDDVSAPLDVETAAQEIRAARDTGALVIVSIHWGLEYQGGASARQKSLAQAFAAAGATLIWGHHPHVLQPVEWIGAQPCEGSKPSQGCTLVLYSLGNALFDQYGLDDTRQSALILVTIGPQGVESVKAIPFVIDVPRSRLVEPDDETRQEILERLKLP